MKKFDSFAFIPQTNKIYLKNFALSLLQWQIVLCVPVQFYLRVGPISREGSVGRTNVGVGATDSRPIE